MSTSFEASARWKAFATRRRDPAGKREAVLQTAAELFLPKSYARVSLNDAAEPRPDGAGRLRKQE